MNALTKVVFVFSFLFFLLRVSTAVDILTVNQQIGDNDTITSESGRFELGFFSPGNSKNRYLGVWYKKGDPKTAIWIANRESPLNDSSGVLKLTDQGILVLVNGTNGVVWNSNSSLAVENPNAQLMDSGNLVIRNGNDSDPDNYIWQSFDYPTDTHMPGMKFGRNKLTGLDRYMTSWKSADDPSRGNFTMRFDINGYPQPILRNGLDIVFRSGPWNGVRFSGLTQLTNDSLYPFRYVNNEKEVYMLHDFIPSSPPMRLVLQPDGYLERMTWNDQNNEWTVFSTAQRDDCDGYALCGSYGICRINQAPKCQCLKGFSPKFQSNWDRSDWTDGCVQNTPLDCQKGDGFVYITGVKVPDTRNAWVNESMNIEECASLCLRNCSCTAYANSDIREGGSGCLLWFGNLTDIRDFTQNGQDIYVRVAASDADSFPSTNSRSNKKRKQVISISTSVTAIALISLVVTLCVLKKRRELLKRKRFMELGFTNEGSEHVELPIFHLNTLFKATNHFSNNNKLGEGGFGPVYQGILPEGQEIAVKMLSKTSRQGLQEFKNEVESIAKLQHRNLVKLLGCCIQGRERMLIYEYMPNKSLDHFIFDQMQRGVLDWPKRFSIIHGIARGLLYLHQDSRLRIIHRDLKAENVLLDDGMNPKISDFGIAKSFGGDETKASTTRVVGTLGYMSPEYASEGLYSTKSDVFSFGVLVLEIVSGKRNRGFSHPDHDLNLLGHAWILLKEERYSEFIDASMGNTCDLSEVIRTINLGLLCVQRFPDDRPNMQSVVLMLGSEGVLPLPKEPCFFTDKSIMDITNSSSFGTQPQITILDAR